MGRSTEDWQSYRLGERIIHTPAVHGAGWQALAGEGMTAETAETAAEGDAGAASVSEAMQDAEAEPSIRAKTLMERLIAHNPERYGECHLRTLQRRLRGYRLQQIQEEMEQALEAPYPVEESKGQDEKPVLPGVNQKG